MVTRNCRTRTINVHRAKKNEATISLSLTEESQQLVVLAVFWKTKNDRDYKACAGISGTSRVCTADMRKIEKTHVSLGLGRLSVSEGEAFCFVPTRGGEKVNALSTHRTPPLWWSMIWFVVDTAFAVSLRLCFIIYASSVHQFYRIRVHP